MTKKEVQKNIVIKYLDGKNESYENVDEIHVFRDKHGIDWITISDYGNATANPNKTHDATIKTNIPLNNVKKYKVITDFKENMIP